jgi:ubiquinone/menaquinone biosynthesis C-methylase UbiE
VTDPKEVVRAGYDAMAERFDVWRERIEGSPELEWAEDLVARLPERPDLLELGSGGARGPTRMLARAGTFVGVDISEQQIRAARRRCPEATFVHADMTEIDFEPESFDAVVSVYVFNHVSRTDLPPLVERIARWLRPGGYLLASFGVSGTLGVVDPDWLGVPMFFASFTEVENLELVHAAGLETVRDETVSIKEPEGEARFQWILARKPPSRTHRGPPSGRE